MQCALTKTEILGGDTWEGERYLHLFLPLSPWLMHRRSVSLYRSSASSHRRRLSSSSVDPIVHNDFLGVCIEKNERFAEFSNTRTDLVELCTIDWRTCMIHIWIFLSQKLICNQGEIRTTTNDKFLYAGLVWTSYAWKRSQINCSYFLVH